MDTLLELKKRKYGTVDKFNGCAYDKYIKQYTNNLPKGYVAYVKINEKILDYYLGDDEKEPFISTTIAFANVFILDESDNSVVDSYCYPLIPFTARTKDDFSSIQEIFDNFYEDQKTITEPICTEAFKNKHLDA